MKKKYNKILLKALLFFQLIFIGTTVNAKELTINELAETVKKLKPDTSYLYIVGEHAFTSEHVLTTQDTMLAARTIKLPATLDQSVLKNVYNEMSIIYLEATYDNDWNFNGLKYVSNVVGKTAQQNTYDINYIDYYDLTKIVEIENLLNKAYAIINSKIESNDKFSVSISGSDLTVTILDATMTSVEALKGTGLPTAAEELLNTKGVESVTLTAAGASVTVNKDNLMDKLGELDELFEELANGTSIIGLNDKTLKVAVNLEEGYIADGETTFTITFEVNGLKPTELVEETLNSLPANDKFTMSLTGNAVTIGILDTTIDSVEDLKGTGLPTAVEEFLNKEGVKSVTLSAVGANVTVTAEDLMSKTTELQELFEALAGSTSVKDLDTKSLTVTVNAEEGYAVLENPVFEVTFEIREVEVTELVEETLNSLPANDKFTMSLTGNAVTVGILDTTMDSVDDLKGTGLPTAVEEFLNQKGVASVTLSITGASVTVSASDLATKTSELQELFEALAGSTSVKDLDTKTLTVTVNEKDGYALVGNPVFEVTFETREVEVTELVEETLSEIPANDKFTMSLTGNNATVAILDTTMDSVEDLKGTGLPTAVEEFLNQKGVESVTLSITGASVTVSASDLMSKTTELQELFEALAGSTSVKDLDTKTLTVKVNAKEGYTLVGEPTFTVTFEVNELKANEIVEEAVAALPTNDKVGVSLTGNDATVAILDTTMDSVDDLKGTGLPTAVEEFLNKEGVKSVTLSITGASVTVTAEDLMSKADDLQELFEALAGSTSVKDLDGKTLTVTVNAEEDHIVVGNPVFEVTFETKEVEVAEIVEETLSEIPANDKFTMSLTGNNATVAILDTTMDSVDDLKGMDLGSAAEDFLNKKGVESVTLTAAGKNVTLTKENLTSKSSELQELFEALAGSTSVKDLDTKTLTVKVNAKEGYTLVGEPTFTVTFEIPEKVEMNTLITNVYNTIDSTVSDEKFTVAQNGNEITVNIVDTTLDSVYALEGTGLATVAEDLLNTEGVNSIVITSEYLPEALPIEINSTNLMSKTDLLQEFFEYLAGSSTPTTGDLVGKSIDLEIILKDGYVASGNKVLEIKFQ